ncbi:putative L-asparaginase [Fusarium austroafricanum]|uniref:Putative L-asparaginase n=1 Tax=Fusarium austroafricanum TaxID=2364996 RepID=A0A8H4KKP7_9HYPO|nr:putative L-asparaginase [Fusarium austroafricanum]
MLVGSGSDEAAREFGLEAVPNSYFTTPFRRTYWHQVVEKGVRQVGSEMGTVGAIVLDSRGRLAAGGSTGGPTGKLDGRIGDTAILGAGFGIADIQSSHGNSSGAGDQILEHLVASNVAKYHSAGATLGDAARRALQAMTSTGVSCSLIALDAHGNLAVESTARLFSVAHASSSKTPTANLRPTTFPLLPSHEFYSDHQLSIGLSRYPVTQGHALAIIKSGNSLFSLEPPEFTKAMVQVSSAVSILKDHYKVERCALASDGSDRLSILPLHGLSKDWHPITSDIKEFHENYPGYVSSKDGPMIEAGRLDEISSRIQQVSRLSSSPDYTFQSAQDDTNLFARIIRGEIQQWRIWEDTNHVAFLTPFANTPGFTVLVPRKHLSSDIFSIQEPDFSDIMLASHLVAGYLKEVFGAERCGMIFEGFEIDYAHVKLIPIHSADADFQISESKDLVTTELRFRALTKAIYCLVPATTDAVSSPMGLGSDSEPVPSNLLREPASIAPSGLADDEQALLRDTTVDYLIKAGFRTGVFHCEARIVNSASAYEFDASKPQYPRLSSKKKIEKDAPAVAILEINARAPGAKETDRIMNSRGLDLYALHLLAACGDAERMRILAIPFNEPEGWWGNSYIGAETGGIFKPVAMFEELAIQAPELSKHIVQWDMLLEPGARVQDPAETGRFRWVAWFLVHSHVSRSHLENLLRDIRSSLRFEMTPFS